MYQSMLSKLLYLVFFASTSIFILGCSPSSSLNKGAGMVYIYEETPTLSTECKYRGEVTGSEGHWYSVLFTPDDVMYEGAINEIKKYSV